MAEEWITVSDTGFAEVVEKKSRFIGEAFHAASQEEAENELQRVRREHYDARHHCSARILGGYAPADGSPAKPPELRFSDDGEPSGTAGRPILEVLQGAGVTDCMIIVTRYFGGTLLGTGGLVRAYTETAKEALAAAKIVRMCPCENLKLIFPYALHDRVRYILKQYGIRGAEPVFTDRVTMRLQTPASEKDALVRELTEQSAGKIIIESEGSCFSCF